ncbi:hypothetical protein KEM60_01508 [Austwickia sp. TVS 96-490-7B]|uniref:PH domain-containing protein n=1 Tax=Austwickia sp. TVS 96-490-7B TaxID=2830843 RepID=UPI001C5710DA|nr:PH domain-containing protein [Austwickia sp. TVS 96-490-7B]MBW3085311.1 hypothetical protein [Austwickia sp. TVS 96-490-7B]
MIEDVSVGVAPSSDVESGSAGGVHPGAERPEVPWQRTAARSMLVSPVKALWDAVPTMAPMVLVGVAKGGWAQWLIVAGLLVPVGTALMQWFFLRFRVAEGQFQVRRGVLARHQTTMQLTKIRAVDVQATAMRRVLRVCDLTISTGAGAPIEVKGVDAAVAHGLRQTLLARASYDGPEGAIPGGVAPDAAVSDALVGGGSGVGGSVSSGVVPSAPEVAVATDLLRWRSSWLRFAPFTMGGIAAAGAVVAFVSNIVRDLDDSSWIGEHIGVVTGWLHAIDPVLLVVVAAVLAVLLIPALAVVTYVLSNWNFRLWRSGDGALHVTRGLLTTHATSVEESRLRGVVLERPLLLRLPSGARGKALLTGVPADHTSTSDLLCPPAPLDEVVGLLGTVLGSADPVTVDLIRHGPIAVRRRFVRGAWCALAWTALWVFLVWQQHWPSWVVSVAVVAWVWEGLLAWGRAQSLGHAWCADYVVGRTGVMPQQRSMVRASAVIGWQFSQTWFQRRVNLVTVQVMVATKGGSVTIPDMPYEQAVALVGAVSPDLCARVRA